MSTQTLERPDTTIREETKPGGGSGLVAHIVKDKAKITEAYFNGTPLEALCGHVWVPSRDPKPLPVCQACKDIFEMAYGEGSAPSE